MRIFGSLLFALVLAGCVHAGSQLAGFSGGLALAIGNGAEDMKPGFNVGFETLGRPHKVIAIGASAEYERLAVRFPESAPDGLHASVHIIQLSAVPRVFGQFTEDFSAFFEADPGFHLVIARIWNSYDSEADAQPHFGLNLGTGFIYKSLLFAFKFKQTFNEGGAARSLVFSLGYEYGASWHEQADY